MIAKMAVYMKVSWGFGVTEHDCSDLAGTLGTGTGGLCDGCHQKGGRIGSRRKRKFVFRSKQQTTGAGTGGGFRAPVEARPARSLFNRSSIALDLQKRYLTAARCVALMTSTPAPTTIAIAPMKKPLAMAAEVP